MEGIRSLRVVVVVLATMGAGCATVVPVHTAGPPESLGRHVLQGYAVAAWDPVVGPALNRFNLQDTPADAKTDLLPGSVGVRFGVLENLDVEFEATRASGSDAESFGIKYQWLGNSLMQSRKGDWVASLRVRYINSKGDAELSDSSNDFLYPLVFDRLHARAWGLEQSVGYHPTDWTVVSLGVNLHRLAVHSRFRETAPPDVWYEDHRHMSLFGAYASVCAVPHSDRFATFICYEQGVQHLQNTFDSSRVRNVPVRALSLGITWKF